MSVTALGNIDTFVVYSITNGIYMINYYDKHLFISKKKLAELAGVSERTFRRYLATRRHILDEMGISPKAQLLPPQASAGSGEIANIPETDPRTPDDHLL